MGHMFHWVFSSFRRKWIIPAIGIVVLAACLLSWVNMRNKVTQLVEVAAPRPAAPLSYEIMQAAQDQVRAVKPAPTEAALYYAYVASVYNDVLSVSNQATALAATQQIMNSFYPARVQYVDQAIADMRREYSLSEPTLDDSKVAAVITTYSNRHKADGRELQWDGVIPSGTGKWRRERPADPFTPRAGEWRRWVVDTPISVPPPPKFGSAEDMRELQNVKQVSSTRTGQDVNIINFWGGVPGSEAPAGIWQNQLYRTIKDDITGDYEMTDKQYASIQKVLALTLSDAFIECWKVKYTYWTARPDMRDPSIDTAMENPNFPGYVSGHSTISKAAADVLGVLVPKYASQWQAMAVEARDSRLKAGIHFDIDNQIGFRVGGEVAKQVITKMQLKPILKSD
jgi:hypothetical protein